MDSLPFDIKERILCSIASPHDLRSFASTAHPWAELIIPRHIQYRILHLGMGDQHPSIWAHLAERKDLAKNIWEVRLTDMSRKRERHPTTLVLSLEDQPENEVEASFLKAFRNFEQLESLTWRTQSCASFMDLYQNPRLLEILNNARHLRNLDLHNWDYLTDVSPQKWQPLFNFAGLQRLHLHDLFFASFTLGSPLTSMLLRCPDIEDLSLTYNQISPCFVECFFPRLRVLVIEGMLGGSESDGDIMQFLKVHKTIEELTWFPPFDVSLLPGSLPALWKMESTHQFVINVLQDKSVPNRALRSIGYLNIDSGSMKILEGIRGNQIQELFLAQYDRIENVHRLAELFPTIATLQIPKFGMPAGEHRTLDDLIFAFSHFPSLDCILNAHIWAFILDMKGYEARRDAITKLAHACPNLRLMTFYDNSRHWRITLHRDGEHVTWDDVVDDRDEY